MMYRVEKKRDSIDVKVYVVRTMENRMCILMDVYVNKSSS